MLPSSLPYDIGGDTLAWYDGIKDNIPILAASFSGSVVSVIIRSDRTIWTGVGTFSSGMVIGCYGGDLLASHIGISNVAGSVLMALAGRQIASWVTGLSIKDAIAIFSRGKTQ
jgi:xanthine/uracil/vitamin C permease (AzgA family)